MNTKHQVNLAAFLVDHPVFTRADWAQIRGLPEASATVRNQLDQARRYGRIKSLERGLYAAVPPGISPDGFQPDRVLAASIVRPDAVFAGHAALELLGVARSVWSECVVYTAKRRAPLRLGAGRVRFLDPPAPHRSPKTALIATRRVVRATHEFRVTGPERTLVEGFRSPALVGGLEELITSTGVLDALDFELLERLLELHDRRSLWASTGWYVTGPGRHFGAPESLIARCRAQRPRQAFYLDRGSKGGVYFGDWNLILPRAIGKPHSDDAEA